MTAAFIVLMVRGCCALRARWVGGGKAVACNFPRAIDILKQEQLLVGFRTTSTVCFNCCGTSGVGAGHCPVAAELLALGDIEFDLQRNCVEHVVICLPYRI